MQNFSSILVKAVEAPFVQWKNAASLIITAPRKPNLSYDSGFDILMLKRHSKASFYPNNYVFPGGQIDKFDKTLKWLNIFEKVDPKFKTNMSQFFIHQKKNTRSPLFPGMFNGEYLPNEIAYRICAIRESFEESGVLILTDKSNQNFHFMKKILEHKDLMAWRKRVHKNAENFIILCEKLNLVPDIWSLHEWSNWLTPTFNGHIFKKRFDTVFYTCCLQERPFTDHDSMETTKAIWDSPHHILYSFHNLKIVSLGPPQTYELRRFFKFKDYSSFKKYVVDRKDKGMRRWLTVLAEFTDGKIISMCPGDDLYPENINAEEFKCYKVVCDTNYNNYKKSAKNLNHIYYPMQKVDSKMVFNCNIAEFSHRCPFTNSIPSIQKSPL